MRHQAIYLDTVQETSRFLRSIAGVDLLAIDTEGASFHRFIDRIYLLQLSTRDCSAQLSSPLSKFDWWRKRVGRRLPSSRV